MNHLEQLVAEWLQYNGYFVRVSVQVGKRNKGGFAGELDVIGVDLAHGHTLHVECSLDALKDADRQKRFAGKFERGRRFYRDAFPGIDLPGELEQIAVLQFASGKVREMGGARLVTVREFIQEVFAGLKGTKPASAAVPSNLPLLRTLQLAEDARRTAASEHRLVPKRVADEVRKTALQTPDGVPPEIDTAG